MDTQNQSFKTSDEEKLLVKKNEEKAVYSMAIGITLMIFNPILIPIPCLLIFSLMYLFFWKQNMSNETFDVIGNAMLILYFGLYIFFAVLGIRWALHGRKTSKRNKADTGLALNSIAVGLAILVPIAVYLTIVHNIW